MNISQIGQMSFVHLCGPLGSILHQSCRDCFSQQVAGSRQCWPSAAPKTSAVVRFRIEKRHAAGLSPSQVQVRLGTRASCSHSCSRVAGSEAELVVDGRLTGERAGKAMFQASGMGSTGKSQANSSPTRSQISPRSEEPPLKGTVATGCHGVRCRRGMGRC